MTTITIYDIEDERLQEVCENNDMTEAEVIELLFDYLDDMKRDNGLK